MRLVLKLVLPGLSNAEVCGGEVIGDDGKASILAPGAGRRRRVDSHTGLVQSLLVNGPHPTWQGFPGKASSAKASHLFMALPRNPKEGI